MKWLLELECAEANIYKCNVFKFVLNCHECGQRISIDRIFRLIELSCRANTWHLINSLKLQLGDDFWRKLNFLENLRRQLIIIQ